MNQPAWLIPSRTTGPPLVAAPAVPAAESSAPAAALDDARPAAEAATPGWYRAVHRAPWTIYVVWAVVVFVVILLVQGGDWFVNALISGVIGGLILGVITLPLLTRAARGSSSVRGAYRRLEEAAAAHHDRVRLTPDQTGVWARGIVAHDPGEAEHVHALLWDASATTTTEPTSESRKAAATLYRLWSATPEGRRAATAAPGSADA